MLLFYSVMVNLRRNLMKYDRTSSEFSDIIEFSSRNRATSELDSIRTFFCSMGSDQVNFVCVHKILTRNSQYDRLNCFFPSPRQILSTNLSDFIGSSENFLEAIGLLRRGFQWIWSDVERCSNNPKLANFRFLDNLQLPIEILYQVVQQLPTVSPLPIFRSNRISSGIFVWGFYEKLSDVGKYLNGPNFCWNIEIPSHSDIRQLPVRVQWSAIH